MKIMKTIRLTVAATMLLLTGMMLAAQEKFGNAEFDKTVHNFGDVMLSDGPLSCTFTMKNIGDKPIVIYSVTTSCGCTGVKWTKEPVLPGKTGMISATYTNDEGPYPFDKSLTVYISGQNRPVILKLRGISHKKKLSPEELYTVRFGALGMKETSLRCGNIEVGGTRSDKVNVANLSDKPIKVEFTEVSKGLSIKVTPNPIPANSIADLQFSVTGLKGIYGKNHYYTIPVINGKHYDEGSENGEKISVYAFTKENFDNLTEQERKDAARPMFTSSSYSFGRIRKGTPVKAEYSFSNTGKSELIIYKVDVDTSESSYSKIPSLKPGEKGSFTVNLDTSGLPSGETLVIVTLTTNSPSRPIVNLFITGWLD